MKQYLLPLIGLVAIVAAMTFGAYGCAGLNAEEMVNVRIPDGLRDPGQPKTLTLPEARRDFEKKARNAEVDFTAYAENIQYGNERAEAMQGLFDWLGASIVNVGDMAVPGWGVLGGTSLVTGLFGWLGMRRPGDAKASEVKAETDKTYDAGANETLMRVLATVGAVNASKKESV